MYNLNIVYHLIASFSYFINYNCYLETCLFKQFKYNSYHLKYMMGFSLYPIYQYPVFIIFKLRNAYFCKEKRFQIV